MKKLSLISVISLLLMCSSIDANGDQLFSESSKGWKAGVVRVNITPETPMWMAGYASRDHESEGTLHDLWVKALALEDANGRQAVLVTADLVGIEKKMSDRIRDKLKEKYGLSRSQIILNTSHTHTGPVLTGLTDLIFPLDSNQADKVIRYSEELEDKIVDLVGDALNSMHPVKLYAQNGVTRFQVNRRNNNEATLSSHTELKGPNDFAVPVLKVLDDTGGLIAVAFGYACHPTVLSTYKWSGDYAGFAQLELEKEHSGVTALFFQGAGADLNPLPRRSVELAKQYGKELAAAVGRVLDEDMKELSPHLSTAYSEIELGLTEPLGKEELLAMVENYSDYRKTWAVDLLDKMQKGEPIITSYPYPVQVWNLGNLPIIALGGELVVEYTITLKEIFGEDIFVLGYSNDVMAYIPTTKILNEGGYEGLTSQMAFGMPSSWESNIETAILREVLNLAEQIGMAVPEPK